MTIDIRGELARHWMQDSRWRVVNAWRSITSKARAMVRNGPSARWAYTPMAASLPLPPAELLTVIQNAPDPAIYVWGGLFAVEDIRALLFRNGLAIERFDRILEFGCGAGRIIRHWSKLPGEVHGSDYDDRMVEWCRKNLPFHFTRNGLDPPTPYADGQFSFIYAFSVFTHMDEDRQLRWISELERILHDGGYLLVTTHGTRHLALLNQEERNRVSEGRLVIRAADKPGGTHFLAFHPDTWVRANFGRRLTLVDHAPWGAAGLTGQDMYLFRRETPSSDVGGQPSIQPAS